MAVVLIGWIFFRAQSWSAACLYLERIITWSHDGTRIVSPYIVAALVAVALTHLVVPKDFDWCADASRRSFPVRTFAYGSLLLMLVCFGATGVSPFIYFQF